MAAADFYAGEGNEICKDPINRENPVSGRAQGLSEIKEKCFG